MKPNRKYVVGYEHNPIFSHHINNIQLTPVKKENKYKITSIKKDNYNIIKSNMTS